MPVLNLRQSKLFFLCLALPAALLSCVKSDGRISKKQMFKLGNHKAWVEKQDSSDPFFKKRRFNHPYRMEPETMGRMIESLHYKGLALLSKKKRVFPEPAGNEIGALLLLGLDKARPNETVKFIYNKKKVIQTSGEIFVTGNRIHWRFFKIRGKEYSRHGSGNWLDTWKLITGKNQKYHGLSGLLGKSAIKNWLVIPVSAYEGPMEKTASPAEHPKEKIAHPGPEDENASVLQEEISGDSEKKLEKALRRLKKLRQQDLISEKEYKKKKAELLEKHF